MLPPARNTLCTALLLLSLFASPLPAGVGDPQVATVHPWCPGELACSTRVTFHWRDDAGSHTASHEFPAHAAGQPIVAWNLPTGDNVKTLWVQYEAAW